MTDDSRLSELLLRWEELRRRNPAAGAEELCRDCPELQGALRQRIEALEAMSQVLRTSPTPAVLVHGSGQHFSEEIKELLRQRLRIAGTIFLGGCTLLLVLTLLNQAYQLGTDWLDYLGLGVVIAILGVLVALLSSRRPLALRELRTLELAVFGVGAVLIGWSQFRWLQAGWLLGLAREGRERLAGLLAAESMTLPWFALCVLYGTFIPNSWRRCLGVVAALTLAPLAVALLAAARENAIERGSLPDLLVTISAWMAFGSAIAVYGCHKIAVLRQEAFEARKLGQYVLKQKLGAGGMGEVFLAEHQLLRRSCAIKVIRPDRGGDPSNFLRFEREVRTMATLTHPNTVEIYDYGRAEDGTFYYVMEYLPGLNLDDMVEQAGALPPARVVHLLRQVCAALREAHAVGLIHRDLKPGNVIACQRGGIHDVVKLLDFGLVKDMTAAEPAPLTMEGMVVGTPVFMSPEQAAGLTLDARSDIYSLGCMAYFLLTGQPPFPRQTVMQVLAAHINETPPAIEALRADVPQDLRAAITRCLEKDPIERFPDVGSMEKALAGCACSGHWTQEDAAAWWRRHGLRVAPRTGTE